MYLVRHILSFTKKTLLDFDSTLLIVKAILYAYRHFIHVIYGLDRNLGFVLVPQAAARCEWLRVTTLVDDLVDGRFLITGTRDDVLVVGGDVAAEHRRRLLRL